MISATADGVPRAGMRRLPCHLLKNPLEHRDSTHGDTGNTISVIYGKYQLLERIGKGGMAEVFKAKSYGVEGFEKLLVIKRILPMYSDNDDFIEMFINEAKIAVSLNHANIVQIYDLGKTGDTYYIAMEYVQGLDLAEVIRRCRRDNQLIPMELCVYIASEVTRGLDYAHRKKDGETNTLNIIHRDVSPQNVLLSTEGEVKITDFGIARAIDRLSVDERAPVQGKFAYMAPEQAIGAPHDRRVDIYSVGVILYEMLTGHRPFAGESPAEIVKAVQRREFHDPDALANRPETPVPAALRDIVLRALSPDPEKRYVSAAEFHEDLMTFSYGLGLRGSAHDLARFVIGLRGTESESSGELLPSVVSRVSSIHEDPINITSVGGPSRDDLSRLTDGGVRPLSQQERDIILLAVSISTGSASLSADLEQAMTDSGGVLLEQMDGDTVFGFGIVSPDRPSSTAATAALHWRDRWTAAPLPGPSPSFGMGILHASLIVELNGTAKINDAYRTAVQGCRDLAARHDRRIRIQDTVAAAIEEDFELLKEEGSQNAILSSASSRSAIRKRMAGRVRELKQIGGLLAEANNRTGRILVLSGPAGIGKTRIMDEVRRRLLAGGLEILWCEVSCMGISKNRPFAAAADLLDRLADAATLDLTEVEQRAAEALRTKRTAPLDAADTLRLTLVHAVTGLCARGLTVLFVDNLCFIDDASLGLLHHLAHAIEHLPVLLALSIRSGYIHGFEESRISTSIETGPLSAAEMSQLVSTELEAEPPAGLLDRLQSICDNNPRCALGYLTALRACGALAVRSGNAVFDRDAEIPGPPLEVRQTVNAELYALPADRRTVIQFASVLGDRFEPEFLAQVIGKPVEELQSILQTLAHGHLLQRAHDHFRFAGAAVRETIYRGIAEEDRRRIHQRIARTLELEFADNLEGRAEQLAVHYWHSASRRQALPFLLQAARETAALQEYSTATRHLLNALELIAQPGKTDAGQLVTVFGQVLQYAMHTRLLPRVLTLCERFIDGPSIRTRPDYLTPMLLNKSHMLLHLGEWDKAMATIAGAERAASLAHRRHLTCAVWQTIGQIHLQQGAVGTAMSFFRDALQATDPSSSSQQANRRALLCFGRVLAAEVVEEDVIRREMDALGNVLTGEEGSALFYLRRALCARLDMLSRTDEAIDLARASVERARTPGLTGDMTVLLQDLGLLQLEQADFRAAFASFRESSDLALLIGQKDILARNEAARHYIDAMKFGSVEAHDRLEAMTIDNNDVLLAILSHLFLGLIDLQARKKSAARRWLQKAKDLGRKWENRRFEPRIDAALASL